MADDANQILAELESLGTAQNRKIYARHGVAGEQFGVSYANLDKLAKRLKKQPELAQPLWASGNHDARALALKIADPKSATLDTLTAWADDLENRVSAGDLGNLTARCSCAQQAIDSWTNASEKTGLWKICAGWAALSAAAAKHANFQREFFESYLARIQAEIAGASNWVRHSMNNALLAIGCRDDEFLRDAALTVAEKIGKIEVDHGETSCKTPAAAPYIHKAWDRRKARSAKKT